MQEKLLITGMTSQQVGRQPGLKYDSVSGLFAEIFRRAEFDVEHRMVTVDEDLDPYYAIIVGISPVLSLNTLYVYHALEMVRRCEAEGRKLFIYIDDWQFKALRGQYQTIMNKPERLTKPFFEFKADHAWAVEHNAQLLATVERLKNEPWPECLVPAFEWGNRDYFDKHFSWAPTKHYLDPSVLARTYDVTFPAERKREWVLGALVANNKWLDANCQLSWPLAKFGKDGERVRESVLIQEYANNRGVICTPYPHVGSGWWRNRIVYAARMGSILLAHPEEVPLGSPYTGISENLSWVEQASDKELDQLAKDQADTYFDHEPSIEIVTEQARRILG